MGWLGWPPEVAMAADVNAIMQAMHGRVDSLRFARGLPPIERKPKHTHADWKEFVQRHNAARAAKRDKKKRAEIARAKAANGK